jgi:hypothetical protein
MNGMDWSAGAARTSNVEGFKVWGKKKEERSKEENQHPHDMSFLREVGS